MNVKISENIHHLQYIPRQKKVNHDQVWSRRINISADKVNAGPSANKINNWMAAAVVEVSASSEKVAKNPPTFAVEFLFKEIYYRV